MAAPTTTATDRAPATRLLDCALAGVLGISGLVFYWLSTHGTWNPDYNQSRPWNPSTSRFFTVQARAIVHGRLWVGARSLGGDCFVHDGRCYGYFGLTPSLLRVPFLPLLSHSPNGLTPVFVTAALTLATGGALATLRHLLVRDALRPSTVVVVAVSALTLGAGGVLSQLSPGNVYDEAVAWAVGFMAVGQYFLVRWWEEPRRRWYWLLVACLVLAANARPTALPFAAVVGAAIAYRAWRQRDGSWLVLGAVAALVPISLAVAVFELKLGSPLPNYLMDREVGGSLATVRWIRIRRIDHQNLNSVAFVPTTLFAYLRPDALAFTPSFPWVDFRFRTSLGPVGFVGPSIRYLGIPSGSLYVGTFSSLTDAVPLAFVAPLVALGLWLRSARQRVPRDRWGLWVAVAAAASWGVALIGVAIEERFLGDAYPLLVVAMLMALPVLVRLWENTTPLIRSAMGTVLVVLVAWQLLVNLALTWRYPGA